MTGYRDNILRSVRPISWDKDGHWYSYQNQRAIEVLGDGNNMFVSAVFHKRDVNGNRWWYGQFMIFDPTENTMQSVDLVVASELDLPVVIAENAGHYVDCGQEKPEVIANRFLQKLRDFHGTGYNGGVHMLTEITN